ncbi:MAG TPA: undecaprenyl-diphosphate phosphatase [Candidatus Amulumruptor caecigallinarius]|uniref:Undecaprenyl-diphosphatase n=1 Tax=Candidatus Amulumruptor caecigallinarius TaxID=2109911 RepID=A0A921E8W1_9BACT|nr:undecaprenyl-diphosphate phosphatase [Candidatus Amulumruptor caecigallinarius]
MSWLDALLLGIIQGLSEYLPISSSGHLEIFRHLLDSKLGSTTSLEFDVTLHVATVLSTIIILWKEFAPLCRSFFTLKRDANTTYVWKLIVSCIPVAIVGICFKDVVESFFSGNLTLVGICLCVTAALLSFAYFFRTRPSIEKHKKGHEITWLDAIVMGIAQAVAVLPGLSRSGTTIATGISMGARREAVARFSFFMVIIPILGQALLDTVKLLQGDTAADSSFEVIGWGPMIIGFIAALLVGCAACKWMLEIVKKGKLVWFAVYCLIVGVLCIVL